MKERYAGDALRMAERLDLAARYVIDNDGVALIFIHKSVDGDCIGSASATATMLRKLGAAAYVAMPEQLPENMAFMGLDDLLFRPDKGFIERRTIDGKPYVKAVSVDCCEGHRMGDCGPLFEMFDDTLVIDHHEVTHLRDDLRWIEPYASSAAELVFYVATALASYKGVKLSDILDKRAAQAILTGVVTDTGRFTYTNTRPETLIVAGELMELGANITEVCYNLFDRKKPQEFLISNTACIRSELLCGNKLAITIVPTEMFEEFNASSDDISDVVSRLRDIDGVELAVVLRETGDGAIRGNLRSKSYFDCSVFAGEYGGGGHKKAAGFNVSGYDIRDLKEEIVKKAEKLL